MQTVGSMNYQTVSMACGEEYRYMLPGDRVSESWDVRADYENAPKRGHYFDRDALRFFGSRNFRTVAPGVSVELQANAPGDRYRVTVWLDRDGVPEPSHGCYHATRREAVACARATWAALA